MAVPPPKKYNKFEWFFFRMGEQFENQFHSFAKFGDTKSDGNTITLSQSDKWMKQAKVIDGKSCTTTDTGIVFKKFKNQRLSFQDYNKFIDDLATSKKINPDDMRKSLTECGQPGRNSAAKAENADVVSRLTDTTKYTGTHKQRFDDSGHGRGIEGRTDTNDNAGAGYVQGYKSKDTYEESKSEKK